MAIAQRPLTDTASQRRVHLPAVGFPTAMFTRSVTAVSRWFVGEGSGPRSYRREGYPEHELYQIVAGRKDRFDGL